MSVTVESTGVLPAKVLVVEAVKHLMAKVDAVRNGLHALLHPEAAAATAGGSAAMAVDGDDADG
jgi:hypothetical protein